MKKIKIAFARFYNAKFAKLNTQEEIVWEFTYQDLQVVARLSNTTSFSIWGPNIRGESNKKSIDPGPDKYPAELYFEVMVYKTVELTKEKFDSLQTGNTGQIAELRMHVKPFEQQMKQALDYCAGMLGARVHPELVALPIFDVDQHYIFMNENYYNIQGGFVFRVKSNVEITATQKGKIQHDVGQLKLQHQNELTDADKLNVASESLGWLLRGWSSDDYVLRFISFFTALEPILPPATIINKKDFTEKRRKLINLISNSVLAQEITEDMLDQFLLTHRLRPSLHDRFKLIASEAKLPGWEKDINDFKTFNKVRNDLLHRGDFPMAKEPHIDHSTLKSFEALVHKYVNYLLYGITKPVQANYTGKSIISISANFKD